MPLFATGDYDPNPPAVLGEKPVTSVEWGVMATSIRPAGTEIRDGRSHHPVDAFTEDQARAFIGLIREKQRAAGIKPDAKLVRRFCTSWEDAE